MEERTITPDTIQSLKLKLNWENNYKSIQSNFCPPPLPPLLRSHAWKVIIINKNWLWTDSQVETRPHFSSERFLTCYSESRSQLSVPEPLVQPRIHVQHGSVIFPKFWLSLQAKKYSKEIMKLSDKCLLYQTQVLIGYPWERDIAKFHLSGLPALSHKTNNYQKPCCVVTNKQTSEICFFCCLLSTIFSCTIIPFSSYKEKILTNVTIKKYLSL